MAFWNQVRRMMDFKTYANGNILGFIGRISPPLSFTLAESSTTFF